MPLTLDAIDLYSRFGFGDGDILEIMTGEPEITEEQFERICNHDPLENLVWRYLLPEIERMIGKPLEVEYINTHHNPMRVKNLPQPVPSEIENISVTVTMAQILECCE